MFKMSLAIVSMSFSWIQLIYLVTFLFTIRNACLYFLPFKKLFGLGKFKKESMVKQTELERMLQAGFM